MKKILTIIAAMLALPVFAQLQMVDITTPTTNTVIHVVSPGILFTNFSTNTYTRYSTVDTNALQIGDTPYQAFTKINANFNLLAGFTNGGSGTTNFNLTGFVQNWTTNNQLSTAGTNTVNLLITNLAIANKNGFGTNTTLISGISVTTTNLSVIGQTWLNNSNLYIYTQLTDYDHLNNFVPTMTSATNPSGVASGSYSAYYYAWKAFDGTPTDTFTMATLPGFIQYQFTNPVAVNVYGFYQAGISTFPKDWTLSGSQDGITYVVLDTRVGYTPVFGYVENVFQITNTVAYYYYRVDVTAANLTSYCTISGIKFGFQTPINVVESSYLLELLSSNGVAINTNRSGGFALNILGSVNVSDNYYINGVPIGGRFNSPPGLNQLYATNWGTGIYTNLNGVFTLDGAFDFTIFTNVYLAQISPSTISSSGFSIPAFTLSYGNGSVEFTNFTLTGTYGNFFGGGTNTPVVSYLSNAPPFSPSSYLLAGVGGNLDGGILTNLNLTGNAASASKVIFGNAEGVVIARSGDDNYHIKWFDGASYFDMDAELHALSFSGVGSGITGITPAQIGAQPASSYRAGITNIPTLTTSQAVLFRTPFSPTVGTNYCVNVSFDTALAAAVGFSTTAKTTNGFTVTLSGTITGAVQVDYAAWPYQ
jgi:hypothetical protein